MKTNPLPAAEKKPPKLRWFQYSLRSLFLLTLLVAIGMSWLTVTMQSQRKQKAAAEAIEAAGGTVEYEQTWVGKLLRDDSLVRVTVVKPRYEDDPFTSPAELPTDVVLEHLQELSQLQELHLADTKITDAGLEHLQVLSQLQVLMLDNTQISDAGLVHLQGLGQLHILSLRNTQVTDAGLAHLQEMTQLQRLDICNTRVTDAGLVHLQGLSQLDWLAIHGTRVTDAGLLHLQRLSRLQWLWLANTQVTNEGVKKLQQALPNCQTDR